MTQGRGNAPMRRFCRQEFDMLSAFVCTSKCTMQLHTGMHYQLTRTSPHGQALKKVLKAGQHARMQT